MTTLFLFICILSFNFFSPTTPTDVVHAILDQDYLYNCQLTDTPRSEIQWTIQGSEVSVNSTSYTIYPNGSLLFTPITTAIAGATVLNQCCLGSNCSPFFIFLSVINTPIAQNASGVEFSSITLVCDSNNSSPPPSFSWYRNGSKISSNRMTMLESVTRADAGVYTCNIANELGSKSTDIQVTIEYMPTAEITGEYQRLAPAGSTVQLSCSFDGLPKPVVSWRYSSDAVFSSSLPIINPALSFPSANSVTLTLSAITYEQTGYYHCLAANAHGNSTSLVRVTVQTAPQPPLISVASVQSRNFTVRWSYQDNGNSPLTHTIVEYKLDTTSTWLSVMIVGNATTEFTPSEQLVANSLYLIRVFVENSINSSLPAETSARTLPLVPPVPRSVTLQVISHLVLELMWEPPTLTSEHTPVEKYECQLKSESEADWRSVVTLSPTQFSYSFNSLNPGTLYLSRVRCGNSAGYSTPWVQVSNRTNHTIPGPPSLQVTSLDFMKIRVNWTPGSDGGRPLETWTIEISKDALTWENRGTFPASLRTYDIDGLEPDTSYYVRIWVTNKIGSSRTVQAQTATLSKSPLGVVDSDITPVSVTATSILLSWIPVNYTDVAVSIEYEINYSLLSDPLLPLSTVRTNGTSYTFQDLLPLSTYSFSIRVTDGEDRSDRDVVFTLTTTLPALNITQTPADSLLGTRVVLSCVFAEKYRDVYEPAFVSWYKGVHLMQEGQKVREDPDYFYLYQHYLVFPELHSSHFGNYSCRVGSQFASKTVTGRSIDTSFQLWEENMVVIITAIVLVSAMIIFLCGLSLILCCVFCVRRHRKAKNARYPVGIPTKSWTNTSTYSPLRSDQTGFNPLKLEPLPPHRDSLTDGSPDHLRGEPTYTTSFLHNLSPGSTLERPVVPRSAILPIPVERSEAESSKSTPIPPPPFSAEEVFGDIASLPKRLTITEGMTSLRAEKNPPPSPPLSVKTAPNYENTSTGSGPDPLEGPHYQNLPEAREPEPADPLLYQNLPLDSGTQHVTGVEMIQMPHNCISTDI